MIGGKTIRRAAANMAKETVFMRIRLTSRLSQRREIRNQAASQSKIATSVTPDKGPVGFQKLRDAAMDGDASPASASRASAREPMAAASTAAAPRPFVILSASRSLMGFGF